MENEDTLKEIEYLVREKLGLLPEQFEPKPVETEENTEETTAETKSGRKR